MDPQGLKHKKTAPEIRNGFKYFAIGFLVNSSFRA